ncbi:MAG: CsgG/HfaB family protein [Brevinematales bacterium]
MKRILYVLGFWLMVIGGWTQTEKVKIAILRIENRLQENVDTDALTESLQIEVVNKRYFLVVERSQLNRILEEQKLSLSGLTEEEQATQIGNLVGAQKIWVGSLARFGDKYMITMKSIDTKTGVIDFADQVYTYDVESLLEVIPDLATRMVRKAGGESVPAYVAKKKSVEQKASQQRSTSSYSYSSSFRPDETFEIGLYRVSISTNVELPDGGALSLMVKSPGDRHSEFYMDLRFYGVKASQDWNLGGINFNLGFMFNLIANGYVLLGGGVGLGLDIPVFTHATKDYSISCFEWTIPLSLQFGIHLGRDFMLVAEASFIPGFGLFISESDYPEPTYNYYTGEWTGEPGRYINVSDETYYVPNDLVSYLENGVSYLYGGLRLSFLF